MKRSNGFWIAAVIAAATVGEGVFALPYVFARAGWLLCMAYFAVLAGLVILAHTAYLATLRKVGEKERLLGLAETYLGKKGFWTGFVAIVAGLLLTLLAYLLLGTQFLVIAFPSLGAPAAFLLLWMLLAIPLFLDGVRVRTLELAGITATGAAIIFIFFNGLHGMIQASTALPLAVWRQASLPFGAILFSLAGWTGIEPAYEAWQERHDGAATHVSASAAAVRRMPWRAVASGTLIAVALYVAFTAGVLGSLSGAQITADTISGLAAWPAWKRGIIALMGFTALVTVYIPISREIKNVLERDLRWRPAAARTTILTVPLMLLALGLHNFITVVGLVGGTFLGVQYLLIVSVARRAIDPGPVYRFCLDLAAVVFIVGAVYEIIAFVVH